MTERKFAGKLESFQIHPATKADVPVIFAFIKKLADYERLAHEVSATEEGLRETLFGRRRTAEVAIGYDLSGPPTVARLLFDWRFDLIFGTAAILLGVLYVLGVRRLRRRGAVG